MGRSLAAIALVHLTLAPAAGGQDRVPTIHVEPGDPPLLVLRPPLDRWRFEVLPEPSEPRYRLSLVDVEFGNRVDVWSFGGRGPAGGGAARHVLETFRASLAGAGPLTSAVEPFGLDRAERSVWRFEAPSGDPVLGVVAHEAWQLDLAGRTIVVVLRSPEPARTGPGRVPSTEALDYIRASIGPLGDRR